MLPGKNTIRLRKRLCFAYTSLAESVADCHVLAVVVHEEPVQYVSGVPVLVMRT